MHDAYDPMGKAEGIKREEYLFLMAQNFALAFHELKGDDEIVCQETCHEHDLLFDMVRKLIECLDVSKTCY